MNPGAAPVVGEEPESSAPHETLDPGEGSPLLGSVTLVADDDAAYFSVDERWDAERR